MTRTNTYLDRVSLRPDANLQKDAFPGSLPWLRDLDLSFRQPVTFMVGENGSGKSTLLEAIAELCSLPVTGGGRNEQSAFGAPEATSDLAPFLRASFTKRPRDGYFFRAEFLAHFATTLERRKADPYFLKFDGSADPYERYGGRSLHARSHGEAFMEVFSAWLSPGLVLMDEPEAALSPQRQVLLLAHMARVVRKAGVQLIVATHSPILMTFPGATLLTLDRETIQPIRLEDTSHYQLTKSILDNPRRVWDELLREGDD